MNIPNKIIEAIELLSFADQGQVLAAVVGFMKDETKPDETQMSDVARATFMLVETILRPIMRRRKRDKACRDAKRALEGKSVNDKQRMDNELIKTVTSTSDVNGMPEPKLSRWERRAIERSMRKAARKGRA